MRAQLPALVLVSIVGPIAGAGAGAGCGGGDGLPAGMPLAAATSLTIVAHQGDELRYLQPDLGDAVVAGGATTVYVTAGNTETGVAAADPHGDGVKAAYAELAGAKLADWACGAITIADHAVEHCRLAGPGLSLIFLGYPDGGHDGAATDSLLQLWEARITSASALPMDGGEPATYTQAGLIATLAAIITTTAPATLRTLEVAATHGDDHSDHMLVGALTVLATAASSAAPRLLAYRGDNIAAEPANAAPATLDRSTGALARYAACTTGCAACGAACPTSQLAAADLALIQRSYPVAMRQSGAGLLQIASDCIAITQAGSNGTVGACAGAPMWQLDARGSLMATNGLCLDTILTGEIVGGTCGADGVGGRYFLDTEGHLWSGVVPAPQADMTLAHLDCVTSAGGRPRAALCGAGRAPTVTLPPLPALR